MTSQNNFQWEATLFSISSLPQDTMVSKYCVLLNKLLDLILKLNFGSQLLSSWHFPVLETKKQPHVLEIDARDSPPPLPASPTYCIQLKMPACPYNKLLTIGHSYLWSYRFSPMTARLIPALIGW